MRLIGIIYIGWIATIGLCEKEKGSSSDVEDRSVGKRQTEDVGTRYAAGSTYASAANAYPREVPAQQTRPAVRYVQVPRSRYVVTAGPNHHQQQLPPEYYSLLQQLEGQRGIQQVDPNDIQQLYIPGEHGPVVEYQTTTTTLSPEAERHVRLQQEYSDRPLREQAETDVQRNQLSKLYKQNPSANPTKKPNPQLPFRTLPQYYAVFDEINGNSPPPQPQVVASRPQAPSPQQQTFLIPQPGAGLRSQPPAGLPQPHIAPSYPQYIAPQSQLLGQGPQVLAAQRPQVLSVQRPQLLATRPGVVATQRKVIPPPPTPHVLSPQSQLLSPQHRFVVPNQQPERVSYSQVQFGSTDLPRTRLVKIPKQQQPVIYATPQPEPSPAYNPQPASIYNPEPAPTYQPKTVVYQQPSRELQSIAYPAPLEATPVHKQTPEQYLIETTKPHHGEQPVVTIPKRPQTQIYYRHPSEEEDINALLAAQHRATTDAPSRSAIYVTQSSPPVRSEHSNPGRALTQDEVHALVNAGFQTTPSPDYLSAYAQQRPSYVRAARKRIPHPVPLTHAERRALTQAGIRNLYRIEPSESQESPVTYVLAIDSNKAKSQS